jgi:hypothetical protein
MYDTTFTSIFVAYGSSIPLPGEPLCRSWTHCIAIAVTGVDLQGSLGSGLELRGSRVVRNKLRVRMIQNGEAMVHTCFIMFLYVSTKGNQNSVGFYFGHLWSITTCPDLRSANA